MSETKELTQKEKSTLVKESRARFADIYKKLIVAFPDEAYSLDSSRGFNLTSIKAQYVVERLNEVVGLDGWSLTGDYTTTDDGVLFFGQLTINDGFKPHIQQSVGFSKTKKLVGDAYKGAKTDSLSKAASLFGLGNEVFKGNVVPPIKPSARTSKTAAGKDF